MKAAAPKPFLRVPSFPGARPASFGDVARAPAVQDVSDIHALLNDIRRSKVGGDYWGSQPALPDPPYTLVRVAEPKPLMRDPPGESMLIWVPGSGLDLDPSVLTVAGPCDPWHLLSGASSVLVDADDELALIAAIAGLPLTVIGEGRFSTLSSNDPHALETAARAKIAEIDYADPFTGDPITAADAVRHCAFWRRLVDGNRDLSAAFGFAFWKRPTVAPLLWGGDGPVPFASSPSETRSGGAVATWKSRVSPDVLEQLEEQGASLVEVEDGFIRSAGLGANCVPPLSIVVDRIGAHFDPSGPSELENMLQNATFAPELLGRAAELRRLIVDSGISKYESGSVPMERRIADRLHVLVPGQVEDDRAVLCGSGPVITNFELLRRAREQVPDAFILYKPHPDVEAGHRIGGIPDDECLTLADEIVRDQPISALIDLVDEVHVNSSLAGFEALLRFKPVTTHGVPFYAGWGLTRDLGSIPARRTTKRSLDELVAAVLLLYPRYLDPVTGLPCPPEILVRRIAEGGMRKQSGAVVQLRRLQGRLKKRFVGLGSR